MPRVPSESENAGLLDSCEDGGVFEKSQKQSRRREVLTWLDHGLVLRAVLVLSLFANGIQFWVWLQRVSTDGCESPLAGLSLDQNMVYGEHSKWGNLSNMTALDELWDGMDVNPGVIALPHDNSLATTQDFPWDKSKGLYMLNSYHNLHCLKVIYSHIRDYQEDRTPEQSMGHIAHCIDLMRADIMCQADDTLLPFEVHSESKRPTVRRCRDWSQLQEFAVTNSACFQRTAPEDPQFDTLLDYMNCPPGSPYYGQVEELKKIMNSA